MTSALLLILLSVNRWEIPAPPPVAPIIIQLVDGGSINVSVSNVVIDGGYIAVSNWPATQTVSGAVAVTGSASIAGQVTIDGGFVAVTQQGGWTAQVAGQVTVDGGLIAITNWPASQAVTGTFYQSTQPVSLASMPSTPVTGTFWQATQPISGTVTTTPPSNASSNVAQINGVTPLMGTGATGTGSQRVTLATNSPGFSTANGTIAADSELQATRAVAYGSSPTAVAAGNQGPAIGDLEGIPYVNNGHPNAVFCQMASGTGTSLAELTGCAAVASKSYYVKSIVMTGGIANAATVPGLIRSGTGTNCGTGTATWATCWHGTADSCVFYFDPPIKVTQAHAICAIDATVGTKSVMLTGYVAP